VFYQDEFTTDGKIFVIASECADERDVAQTLLHETCGHYGIRSYLGTDADLVLNQVAYSFPKEIEAKCKQYGLNPNNLQDRRCAAEEVLANLAEKSFDQEQVNKFKTATNKFLRNNIPGFAEKPLTKDELLNLVNCGKHYVQNYAVNFSITSHAKHLQSQAKIKGSLVITIKSPVRRTPTKIYDCGNRLRIEGLFNEQAMRKFLDTYIATYGNDAPLKVNGSRSFKNALIKYAAEHHYQIKFEDPKLEEKRLKAEEKAYKKQAKLQEKENSIKAGGLGFIAPKLKDDNEVTKHPSEPPLTKEQVNSCEKQTLNVAKPDFTVDAKGNVFVSDENTKSNFVVDSAGNVQELNIKNNQDESVNNVDKPNFKYTTLERAQILQGKPVINLNSNETPQGKFKEIKERATDLFVNKWGGKVTNPELGEITLNKNSIKDTMAHDMNRYKAISFLAIKDVLEKGVTIAQGKRNNLVESYFVVAPITIDNKESMVLVIVNKDTNTNRMYIHNITLKENLLRSNISEAHLSKIVNDQQNGLSSAGDLDSLSIYKSNSKISVNEAFDIVSTYLKLNIKEINQNLPKNDYWIKEFDYGIDKLTQAEAGHLRAASSVDAIRIRIVNARHEAIGTVDARRTTKTQEKIADFSEKNHRKPQPNIKEPSFDYTNEISFADNPPIDAYADLPPIEAYDFDPFAEVNANNLRNNLGNVSNEQTNKTQENKSLANDEYVKAQFKNNFETIKSNQTHKPQENQTQEIDNSFNSSTLEIPNNEELAQEKQKAYLMAKDGLTALEAEEEINRLNAINDLPTNDKIKLPNNFTTNQQLPDAIVLNPLNSANNHPNYEQAKAGDIRNAAFLAKDLVTDEHLSKLKEVIPTNAIIASVNSIEQSGKNAIPFAVAEYISYNLNLGLDTNIK